MKAITKKKAKDVKKVEVIYYIASQNFDLKMETMIILEKLESDRFTEDQLDSFIKSMETLLLEDLNQSARHSTTDLKVGLVHL